MSYDDGKSAHSKQARKFRLFSHATPQRDVYCCFTQLKKKKIKLSGELQRQCLVIAYGIWTLLNFFWKGLLINLQKKILINCTVTI